MKAMAPENKERTLIAPPSNVENQAYFDAAAQSELLVGKCRDCNQHHFYPRKICPLCFSMNVEWIAGGARGSIYSFSVTRRGVTQPYAIAYVKIDEGVTLLTNIVDCDFDSLRIGQLVKLVFKPCENGNLLPVFTPT
jgi:uncharacterized protein